MSGLPQDPKAEAAVLGSIMLRPSVWDQVEHLQPEDFGSPGYAAVFAAMRSLARNAEPIDVVTVEAQLKADGTDKLAGGLVGVSSLAGAVGTWHHVEAYAKSVTQTARARGVWMLGSELREAVSDGDPRDIDTLVGEFASRLAQFECGSTDGIIPASEAMLFAIDDAEKRRTGQIQSVSTGLPSLDVAIEGGLEPGLVYVIMARPGMGKTAFLLNLLSHAAMGDAPLPSLMFSMEMNKLQIGRRLLALHSEVELSYVKKPTTPHQVAKMSAAQARALRSKLGLLPGRITLRRLISTTRQWRRANRGRVGPLAVDYLQLIDSDPDLRRMQRSEAVGIMSRELKLLAQELEIPVLELAQLNRDLEKRPDKRPILADLRESGSIEQDADTVLSLFREYVYDQSKDVHACEVGIPKQREGGTGLIVPVRFVPWLTKFEEEERQVA